MDNKKKLFNNHHPPHQTNETNKKDLNNNKNTKKKNKVEDEDDDEIIGEDGIYKDLQIEDFELKNKDNLKEWMFMLQESRKISDGTNRTYYEISRKHTHDYPDIPLKKYISCTKKKDLRRGNYIINSSIESFIIKNTNTYNYIIRLCTHLRNTLSYSCIAFIQSDLIKNRGLFFKYFKKYQKFYIGVIDVHLGVFYCAIIFKCSSDDDNNNNNNNNSNNNNNEFKILDYPIPETIICDVNDEDYVSILKEMVKYEDMFFFCCECVNYD
jgi:hypothetical protein